MSGDWDEETEFLVIGSGAGGLTAALVAAHEGMKVLVCEKSARIGGTSATSGGAIWVADSAPARRARYVDSVARGQEYLRAETGEFARDELIEAFVTAGPEMVDYLESRTDMHFDVTALPEYHAESPGGVEGGRCLLPKPFDGRLLGKDFGLLKPPLDTHTILGGMMINFTEIPLMLKPFQSWSAFRKVVSLAGRYALDRLRFRRGTRLLSGNALMARLLFSLRRTGAEIRTGAALVSLITNGERVTGAVVAYGGRHVRVAVRKAIVLASGGAGQKSPLRDDLTAAFPHDATLIHADNTGDGIRSALEIGAVIDRGVATPALWTAASQRREKNGTVTVYPYGYIDRGKPGAMAVNARGERFVNESDSYHDVVMAMYRDHTGTEAPRAHLVCDSTFIWSYGLGLVYPYNLNLRKHLKLGYLHRADTLEALAGQIGVDPAGLRKSVERHNAFARTGVDEDFGKGSRVFNRWNGDRGITPNPCLREIRSAPFYALPITPAPLGSNIGLMTNGDAQVLDGRGDAIAGLFAIGGDTSSVMRGLCPGGGVTLGPAMVFGYRAARFATALRECGQRDA